VTALKPVRLKRVADIKHASKTEIVTAVLAILGGATRAISVDELAVACHRLEPKSFSWPEYSWLPNLDNVRVTLVDVGRSGAAETLTNGRSRQKLWRLTDRGQEWVASNAGLLDELRRRLPDPEAASTLNVASLAAVAVYHVLARREASVAPRDLVVAEAFRLFPTAFGLSGFAGWPDATRVDQAIRANDGLLVRDDTVVIKAAYRPQLAEIARSLISTERGFGSDRRRVVKGSAQKAVSRVETSKLYREFCHHGEVAVIDVGQLCDLLSITLEADSDVLRARLNTLTGLLEEAERSDLSDFVKWLKTQLAARNWRVLTDTREVGDGD